MTISAETASPPAANENIRYLFGPVTDFLMLGGGAIILLPLLALVPLKYEFQVAFGALILANFINHPHFAHSYQIFYSNFSNKVSGNGYSKDLQYRYIFAGIIVPIIIALYYAIAIRTNSHVAIGYTVNAMAFFVGWHYVKQGYGMIIVDSVLKKSFFNDSEKKSLLYNSYIVWIFSWVKTNQIVQEKNYFELKYYTFDIPEELYYLLLVMSIVSTAYLAYLLIRSYAPRVQNLPVSGIVAYLVSIYMWLLFVTINPLWVFLVPALHSLQYLAVVWRYQTNVELRRSDALEPFEAPLAKIGPRYRLRVASFMLFGFLLGASGFFLFPFLMDQVIAYDKELFGASLFVVVFWVFINIHHYFLDNVMWRRGNPEVATNLFR